MTQIYHFGCPGLSVATDQGKIAESQGRVREKAGNLFFQILWEPCFDYVGDLEFQDFKENVDKLTIRVLCLYVVCASI